MDATRSSAPTYRLHVRPANSPRCAGAGQVPAACSRWSGWADPLMSEEPPVCRPHHWTGRTVPLDAGSGGPTTADRDSVVDRLWCCGRDGGSPLRTAGRAGVHRWTRRPRVINNRSVIEHVRVHVDEPRGAVDLRRSGHDRFCPGPRRDGCRQGCPVRRTDDGIRCVDGSRRMRAGGSDRRGGTDTGPRPGVTSNVPDVTPGRRGPGSAGSQRPDRRAGRRTGRVRPCSSPAPGSNR